MCYTDSLYFYQHFIILFFVGGGISLFYFLLHKGESVKRWVSGGCLLLCAVVVVWYFLPFRIPVDPDSLRDGGVAVYVEDRLPLTAAEERRIAELCNELTFHRQIAAHEWTLPQSSVVLQGNESAEIFLSDTEGRSLHLICSLQEKGLLFYPGLHCITDLHDRASNWEPLVAYLKEIILSHGLSLPEG